MLNTDNLAHTGTKFSRSIYIGKIKKTTLSKPVDALNVGEQEQYSCLSEQMKWGKEHGYNLVLTRDSSEIDCWMIRDSSMDDLNPLFKKTILQVF
ncbi:MAG: hypothetical protein RIG61_04930 [Deltaproteobacteria bacterium]